MKNTIAASHFARSNSRLSFAALRKSLLILPACALAMAGSAQAASKTWDPGLGAGAGTNGSGTWDNGTTANWTTGSADTTFSATDTAVVGVSGGSGAYTISVAPVGVTATGLTLNSAGTGAYTFQGGQINLIGATALTVNNSVTFNSVVNNQGTSNIAFLTAGQTVTFNAGGQISSGASGASSATSTIVVNSGSYLSGSTTFDIGTSGSAGSTSGLSGGLVYNNGALLSSAGSFATGYTGNGLTTIDGGTLNFLTNGFLIAGRVNSSGSLGRVVLNTGTITSQAGLINFTSTGGSGEIDVNGGSYTVSGTGTVTGTGSASSGTLSIGLSTSSGSGVLNITGGIVTVGTINFGGGNGFTASTGGTNSLTMSGGSLFVGGATNTLGIVNQATGGTASITLSNALVGAAGAWSSAMNMTFGANTNTFDAASAAGTAANITLTGNLVTGAAGLTKIGGGALALSGANTYTGTTTVNQGTLTLDFANATAATNIIKTGNALAMGGGTLNLTGKANTTNSQTFGSTTINAGSSAFTINNSATANPDSIALGTLTRNIGGAVAFTLPTNGTNSATNGYATGSGTASTILTDSHGTAYATVGTTDWAAKDAGNTFILGLSTVSGYTTNTASVLSGNADFANATATTTLAAASTTITSLRMNNTTADTVALNGKTLITGGILVGSGVTTANETISGTGSLEGTANGDLDIIDYSTGTTGLSISSSIVDNTGATGLTLSGTGILTLSGANSYTGATTVNSGSTLKLTAGTLTGTAITSGGTFTQSGGVISGAASVNVIGGTTTLAGANTFTGPVSVSGYGNLKVTTLNSVSGGSASSSTGAPTTVANGTISLGSGVTSGTLTVTGTGETTDRVINLAGTSGGGVIDTGTGSGLLKFTSALTATGVGPKTLTLQGSTTAATGEFAGAIVNSSSDTTGVTKLGTSTWTLSGTDSYTGATTITGGTLILTGTLGSGTPSALFGGVGGTAITSSATFTENGAGSIVGASSLTVSGGTTTLNNANTYTGGTTVTSGTLTVGNVGALGSTTDPVRLSGGTLDLKTDTSVNAYNIYVSNGTTIDSDKATSASAGITQTLGTLAYSANSTVTVAAGTNATSGTPTIAFGPLTFTGSAANQVIATLAPTTATATVASAQGFVSAGSIETLSLAGTSTGANTVTGAITDGFLGGTLALNKTGASTWTLSGANTYSGATTINAGSLNVTTLNKVSGGSASSSLGAPVTVNNGTIGLGTTAGLLTGSLVDTGTGETSDRVISLIGNGVIDQSGLSGTLNLSGGITGIDSTAGTGKTITLQGSTAGTGQVSGIISDAPTSTIAVSNGLAGNSGTTTLTIANASSLFGVGVSVTGTNIAGGTTVTAVSGNQVTLSAGTSGAITAGQALTIGAGTAATTGLTKAGTGTWVLSNANTYTGLTTVGGGILNLNNANALNTATLNGGVKFSGGTLQYTSASAAGADYSGKIAGSGSAISVDTNGQNVTYGNSIASTNTAGLTKLGTGTLTLGASNSYTGVNTFTNGTVAISASGNLGGTTSTLLFNGGTLETTANSFSLASGQTTSIAAGSTANFQVDGSASLTLNGAVGQVASSGALTKTGTGTLAFNGANSYTGLTTISAGTIDYQNSTAFGAGSITVASGATAKTEVNGAPAITITGAGASGSTGALESNGGTTYTGLLTLGGNATISSDGTSNLFDLNGSPITGSGDTLTVAGTGDVEIDSVLGTVSGGLTQNSSGLLIMAGANTYTGATNVNSGELVAGVASVSGTSGAFGLNSAVTVASGATASITDGGNFNTQIGSLAGAGSVTLGSATLTTGGNSTSTTFSGVISGAGGKLTKIGTGTQTLSNTNTYTGPTQINNGVLSVTGSLASGSTVTVGGSTATVLSTPTLNGTGTVFGNVIVASAGAGSAGTITPGTATNLYGTFHVGGAISFQAGSVFALNMSGASSTGELIIGGAATIASGADISINVGTSLTGSSYVLATAASGLNGATPFTVLGSLPAGYQLVYTGTALDLNLIPSATSTTFTLSVAAGSTLLHQGATTTLTSTITNTGGTGADTLNYTGLGASSSLSNGTGTTSGGGPLANTSPGNTGTNTSTYTATNVGSDTVTSTVGTATNATLGGSATLSGTAGTTTINVYSGLSTWNVNGGGSWSTAGTGAFAAGANWGANQGAPGVTAGFANTDTATFDNTALAHHTNATVTLDGATPSLKAITFNTDSGSGYTIAQGSGGSLALAGNGGNATVTVTSGTHTISAPVSLTTSADVNVASGQQITFSGAMSGTGALNNIGAGATILSNSTGNSYSGGTVISAGKLYVNNTSGSGTGTGSVSVTSGGTLAGSGTIKPTGGAGVTIGNGATLKSGSSQTAYATVNSGNGRVNGTGTGGGLTLDNTEASSSLLTVNGGATLTFDLGSSTAFNGGSGALNFANPNTNSTFLNITGSTVDQIFSNTTVADTIKLIDLTNGSTGVSLTLRSQNPYLLIQTALGNNSDFANLVTTGGTGVNGYVLGVSNGTGGYTAFNLGAYDINGNQVNTSTNLEGLQLYLYNGDLEVVPEPGTWALMLGGLALLVIVQRSRRRNS